MGYAEAIDFVAQRIERGLVDADLSHLLPHAGKVMIGVPVHLGVTGTSRNVTPAGDRDTHEAEIG